MKCGKKREKTSTRHLSLCVRFCVCEHHQLGWYGLNNRGLCLYSAGIKCKSINYLNMEKKLLAKIRRILSKINSNTHTHSHTHTQCTIYTELKHTFHSPTLSFKFGRWTMKIYTRPTNSDGSNLYVTQPKMKCFHFNMMPPLSSPSSSASMPLGTRFIWYN